MKFREEKQPIADEEERALASDVRRLARAVGDGTEAGPPDAYWPNFLVRANARIDEETSGKALSISWAARVAIPGVVAVVSFLIGLHYYVPENPRDELSVADVVLAMPPAAVDSLLVDPSRVEPSLSIADVATDIFEMGRAQIAEYLIVNGNTTAAVEGMTEKEANELLAALAASGN